MFIKHLIAYHFSIMNEPYLFYSARFTGSCVDHEVFGYYIIKGNK